MSWIGVVWRKMDRVLNGSVKKRARSRPLPRFGGKVKYALLLSALGLIASVTLDLYYGEMRGLLSSPWRGSGERFDRSGSQIVFEEPYAEAPIEPQAGPMGEVIVVEDSIVKGEAMFEILKNAGVSPQEAIEAIKAARSSYNLAKINVGRPYKIETSVSGSLLKLQYEIDSARTLLLEKREDGFKATIRKETFNTYMETVKGDINSSLFDAILEVGEEPYLALELAKIFAWDIDFSTDLRPGDSFRFAVEKNYRKGQFVKYGRITIAEIKNAGRLYRAVYFDDGKDASGYYTPDGKAVRKQFLKSPLKYTRISSGYTRKRFHPILGRFMPHLGIDYAAPEGTPVVAVADGVITWAKRKGGNGKFIAIKHPSGYKSSYGHLSGYARNIRPSTRVKQGQVVGYVGSTGLATGPHLDFRIVQYGKYINPLKLKSVQADPLGPKQLAVFKKIVEERMAMFEGAEMKLASRSEGASQTDVD